MKWFTAQTLADDPRKAHIVIDKPIGSDWAPDWIKDFVNELPARDFIDAVDALGELDEIALELNSPGGDVASGIRIMNYLKNHPAQVHVIVTGMAASIATVIMMAGNTRTMGVGATIGLHRASALMLGFFNVREMQETARNLSVIDDAVVDCYAGVTGKSAEEIGELLDRGNTFMGAEEAIEWGFATDKDAKLAAVASADLKPFLRQLEQEGRIARLRAQLDGREENNDQISATDALAKAFDLKPDEVGPQLADLTGQIIALRQLQAGTAEGFEFTPEALAEICPSVVAAIEAAAIARQGQVTTEAVDTERGRVLAIVKACQTTSQTQLLEKLIINGMAQDSATEYIMDVAAASDPNIHNSHSPEGGQQPVISTTSIYARRKSKANH